MRDIASIVLNLEDELDMRYIDQWAARLNLEMTWQEMQRRIQSLRNQADAS